MKKMTSIAAIAAEKGLTIMFEGSTGINCRIAFC